MDESQNASMVCQTCRLTTVQVFLPGTLALTRKQLGSLDRVSRVVRLGVYVAATPDFKEHPKIADAASELLRDVFGEQTVSSRLVFGVASLPLGSPVELEVILEVKS